jgi:hypothetical protein
VEEGGDCNHFTNVINPRKKGSSSNITVGTEQLSYIIRESHLLVVAG